MRTWAAIGGFCRRRSGRSLGGLLVTVGWRWIFLVNVPIGLIAIAVGWWNLPEVAGHAVKRPSAWAAFLVTGGIGALTLAIVKVNDWGWQSPGSTWLCCLARLPDVVRSALFEFEQPVRRSRTVPYSSVHRRSVGDGTLLHCLRRDAVFHRDVGADRMGHVPGKQGIGNCSGALLVPLMSLPSAGRLIARFGGFRHHRRHRILHRRLGFLGQLHRAGAERGLVASSPARFPLAWGVRLTFPTLMGISASALPPSPFATGSGVINMIRQAAIAVGVAIHVAVVALPASPMDRVTVFHRGWWIMGAITAVGLIPTLWLIRVRRLPHTASPM